MTVELHKALQQGLNNAIQPLLWSVVEFHAEILAKLMEHTT